MSMPTNESDRRRFHRMNASQPCKVLDPRSGRTYNGITINLSSQGALVELKQPMPISPGDEVSIAVMLMPRTGVIRAKDMMDARVVRVMDRDEPIIAIEYIAKMSDAPRLAA